MKGGPSVSLAAPKNSGHVIFISVKTSRLYKTLWTIDPFLYNKHT